MSLFEQRPQQSASIVETLPDDGHGHRPRRSQCGTDQHVDRKVNADEDTAQTDSCGHHQSRNAEPTIDHQYGNGQGESDCRVVGRKGLWPAAADR